MSSTQETKMKIKDQPLYKHGKYVYGCCVHKEGDKVTFFLEPTPELSYLVRWCNYQLDFDIRVTTKPIDVINQNQDLDFDLDLHKPTTMFVKKAKNDDEFNKNRDQPLYRIPIEGENKGMIEVRFDTSFFFEYNGVFVYEFSIREVKAQRVYIAKSVPCFVLKDQKLKQKILYLLICLIFKNTKEIERKQIKRLFKVVSLNDEFAKKCFKSWEAGLVRGANLSKGKDLPNLLSWCMKCNDVLINCNILCKYDIIFCSLSREKTEEILRNYEEGSILIRIGSSLDLVMSTCLNRKFMHVSVTPCTEKELMKNMVPVLTRVICFDSTPLPINNFKNLFKAEGIQL